MGGKSHEGNTFQVIHILLLFEKAVLKLSCSVSFYRNTEIYMYKNKGKLDIIYIGSFFFLFWIFDRALFAKCQDCPPLTPHHLCELIVLEQAEKLD